MESVHETASCSFITEPINLKKMLAGIRQDPLSLCVESGISLKEKFLKAIPEFNGDYEKLAESIDCGHLNCGTSGNSAFTNNFEIPEGTNFQTLKFQKKDVDERCHNAKYSLMVHNDMQNGMFPSNKSLFKRKAEEISSDTIILPEILFTVKIFHPTAYNPNEAQQMKLMPNQEFLVTGHQILTVLREKISCTTDENSPGDLSKNPDAPCTVTFKDMYPSGFFYINGCFYNDMQASNSVDLSKVIREWAETKACGIGPFTAQLMEGTQFVDLTIQLGYPYVYCHQGDCEHLFVFTDVRAMTEDDCLDRQSYPMLNKYFSKNRTGCMICQQFTACWVVEADTLPISPSFICDVCLKNFFYTKDGKKNVEFKLRKFRDRSTIV